MVGTQDFALCICPMNKAIIELEVEGNIERKALFNVVVWNKIFHQELSRYV